ncbi:MAG: endopeptidase La [Christensenellaceae bacterium]|jgi:ATP-dependent Lon protease|nr:endopeptidase La [Christensenellaceae bacterium]
MAKPTQTLRMAPLRSVTVYPKMLVHLDVAREESKRAFLDAHGADEPLFLLTQRNHEEDPGASDLYSIGTVAVVKQIAKLPNGMLRVLAEGLFRAELIDFFSEGGCRYAQIGLIEEKRGSSEAELSALRQMLLERFDELSSLSPLPPDVIAAIHSLQEEGQLADTIAAKALMDLEKEQAILALLSLRERIERLCLYLDENIERKRLQQSIEHRVRQQMEKNHREYFLREQEKVIREELGEGESSAASLYRERLDSLPIQSEAFEKISKEISRLERLSPSSPETEVSRNYLDTLLALPWGRTTQDSLDLGHAREVLDEDHFGMEKVKARILEFLAVHSLTHAKKGAALCLVGPPGVGKTSIAQSVARALGRNFARLSLGGVHDESEIRGHRRTYIGSMPGRLLTAMRQAGSMNPLLLMDEIDKMAASHNGDPAAALLEALDAEQNATFRDHYADIPFDLSGALFFVTANTLETVPRALLDRMEVIELGGYTELEKLEIAKRHLVPKQLKRHGLTKGFLKLSDETLRAIIEKYTREAGVRALEREIASVCRKAAMQRLEGKKSLRVSPKKLHEFLGAPRFLREKGEQGPRVGSVNGLAWTAAGGEMLVVEAVPMRGSGQLLLTGNLGEVMQESAKAAVSYIRAHAGELGVDPEFYQNTDIHIHVPEGATPKDGPSAGVTIASAVASALSGKPARQDISMTGEITLRGRVLPIGGLKEKTLAAHRQGIQTVLFPLDNLYELGEIPEIVRGDLRMVGVKNVDEVLSRVLLGEAPQSPPAP